MEQIYACSYRPLLACHHDDAEDDGARGRYQRGRPARAAAAPGGQRPFVAVEVGEAGDAPDREREDDGDPDAGDQRGDIVCSSSLVSTTTAITQLAGTGAPRRERRAKTATISESDIRVTRTGPRAPLPKIAVAP